MPINLAATAAGYTARATQISLPGTTWTQILVADSRRWFVRFYSGYVTPSIAYISPVHLGVPITGLTTAPWSEEYKFRDCPALVTGEWWAYANVAVTLTIFEELYTGSN